MGNLDLVHRFGFDAHINRVILVIVFDRLQQTMQHHIGGGVDLFRPERRLEMIVHGLCLLLSLTGVGDGIPIASGSTSCSRRGLLLAVV